MPSTDNPLETTLTPAQRRELRRIADGERAGDDFPAAGWFDSRPARALLEQGLIERLEHKAALGGPGAIGGITAEWHLVRLTAQGRKALRSIV